MPRNSSEFVPTYRRHKQSGQAIVTIGGRDHLLGPHGTKASRIEYDRLIAEWLAAGRTTIHNTAVTIGELLNAYRKHCEATYSTTSGNAKVESNIRYALKPLRQLYGHTSAADFGPLKFKTLIGEYVRLGWCRQNINRHIARAKAFFKWAVANEFIPSSVIHGLQAVDGLRRGRSEAPEAEPVRPVNEAHVHAIRSFVSRQVWTMIELQLLTGARPGEIVLMRGCDIDTSAPALWTYTPSKHKTQNHGIARTIYFGPRAQDILRPFLKTDLQAFMFSPADAEAERRAKLSEARKTPLSCGNKPGSNRKRHPQRQVGDRYTREAYATAIYRGCQLAFPYPDEAKSDADRKDWRNSHYWSANQLRHTAATNIRKQFGAEAAQTILGHQQLRTTEIYAERNHESAMRIMTKIG